MNLAQCGWSEHAISVSTCAIRMQPYLMFSVSGTLLLQIPTDTRLLLSFSTNVLEAPRILLDLCVDSFTCTLNNLQAVRPTHWTVWVVLWGLWSTLVWQWFLEREKHCWQPTNSSLSQRLESVMISLNPSVDFCILSVNSNDESWWIMMNHVPLNRNFGGQPLGDHHDQHADYASGSTGKRLWRASQACRDAQETSGKHGEAKHFVLEALFKYGNINNWFTLHVWRVIKDTDLGNRKVDEKYTFCMRFSRSQVSSPVWVAHDA